MTAALLRIARVLVAQGVSYALLTWGGIRLPIVDITVGALVNGLFKWLRDTFPKSTILEWFPL